MSTLESVDAILFRWPHVHELSVVNWKIKRVDLLIGGGVPVVY